MDDLEFKIAFPKISVVVLTYNRPCILEQLLNDLVKIEYELLEIILVDNNSVPGLENLLIKFPAVQYIKLNANKGAVARNYGIKKARGEIIITIDDDIFGINDVTLYKLIELFSSNVVGAICFKVVDSVNKNVCNWCHHRVIEDWADKSFETYEISEGAVAFRNIAFQQTGGYPQSFFISHEGIDVSCRLLNNGYCIKYSPEIVVTHCHAESGRTSWRRYYYDTRNSIWVYVRNFPWLWMGRKLFFPLFVMFVYSLRDGFCKYWFKGVVDGISGVKKELEFRVVIAECTKKKMKQIDKHKAGFFFMLKKRLFSKDVSI